MNKKLIAALAAAVLAAYGMTLFGPFVIDDVGFVRDNAVFNLGFGDFLRAIFSPDYFALTGERTYQPLVTLLHCFIHLSPFLCRLSGIVIHALNACLVFLLCKKLKADDRAAFIAALLFALFPANTEAVNVSSFKGHTIALTFSAASLLLWSGPASFVCYALALLSKETALIVPVFALAISWREKEKKSTELVALGVLTAAYFVFRLLLLKPFPVAPLHYNPLSCLAWYLRMLFLPFPLCLAHGAVKVDALFLVPIVLFVALFWSAREESSAYLAAAWIILALLPVLHLIPFREFNPVADRYLYMASAGFCALAAKPLAQRSNRFVLYAALAVWAGLTLKRNGLYLDPKTLYTQTADCASDVPQAQTLLGDYDLSTGDFLGARASYQKALDLDPLQSDAVENIGVAEYMCGEKLAGIASLERAAAALPSSARVRYNLGQFYAAEGRTKKARASFEAALKIDPGYEPARAAIAALAKAKR